MQIGQVDKSLEELNVELAYLTHITNGLLFSNKDTNGLLDNNDPDKDSWRHMVKRISHEYDVMQNQLTGLNGLPYNAKEIKALNARIIDSVVIVKAQKELAFEAFLGDLSRGKLKRYSHHELISFTSEFDTKLGFGGFSKVYQCQLPEGVQGAAKVLIERDDQNKDSVRDVFVIEVSTMIKASHPNLIKLYGFCYDNNMIALVYEYMENGSFDRVLFKKDIMVDWNTLYGIAVEVAKVIAYLHHECGDQIIHHDIKPANVLLDSSLSPKLTDFGVSTILTRDVSHYVTASIRGTSSYIATEIRSAPSKVTYKCDVYSYGKMLFDILGMRVNNECQTLFPKHVWAKYDAGEFDEILEACNIYEEDKEKATVLSMIGFWCIQCTAEHRPSMNDVVYILEHKLLVPKPEIPDYAPDGHFSLQKSQDGTYRKVSFPPSKSHQRKLAKETEGYKAYMKKWRGEVFEKDVVEVYPRSPPEIFTYEDLMSYTKEFSTIIVSNSYTTLYRGEFTNGEQVAVKVLRKDANPCGYTARSEERFMAELEAMSSISHPNIVKLHGFCLEINMKAVVLEYTENGSLEKLLFENENRSIEWHHLYCIAVETAKAVSYLHNVCDGLVLHRNIKSSGILLDSYLSPKLTEFDFTEEVSSELTHTNVGKLVRSNPYVAPEMLFPSSPVNKSKCDVYSFGVVLLEIFGRQRAIFGNICSSIIYWEKIESGQVEELLREYGFREKNKQHAWTLLMVAFWCIQYTPESRPSMNIVVKMLENEMEVIKPPNPFYPRKLQ